jgi:peptide/nickel transport system substrate-binding protein
MMLLRRIRKPKLLVFTPLLLALAFAVACGAAATATPAPPAAKAPVAAPAVPAAPAAAATPTAKPAATPIPAAKPAVARLVVAVPPLAHDTNIPWFTSGSGMTQFRPMMEQLIGSNVRTSAYEPTLLATKWEMAPGAKQWTFELRQGVNFHFGFGPFTAKDVEHSWQMISQKESIQTHAAFWKQTVERVEAVSDQKVVFHLKRPEPELAYFAAEQTGWPMLSKEQWDKEGQVGFEKRPAFTGPYHFKERRLGESLLYEREEKHWRHQGDFKEIQLRWPPEDATRQAMLLANEAHIVFISRDLQESAVARGMKVARSAQPGLKTVLVLGGNYFTDPTKLDAQAPLVNKKVREAVNRAVNRDELNKVILKGSGEPMMVTGYHPTLGAWKPEWEARFKEGYSYNPAKAKALLSEAGYPNGFKVKLILAPISGFPEVNDITEAISLYLQAVGISSEIIQVEFNKLRDMYRDKDHQGNMFVFRASMVPTFDRFPLFYASDKAKGGVVNVFNHSFMDERWGKFQQSVDPAERTRLLTEIGDFILDEYTIVPLFWIPIEATVNPKVVAEYLFPGPFFGNQTHWELVKAAK